MREHCLYYGAYCRSGDLRQTYFVPESDKDKKESNDTGFYESWTKPTYSSDYTTVEPSAVSGLIKVLFTFHLLTLAFILLVPNITLRPSISLLSFISL